MAPWSSHRVTSSRTSSSTAWKVAARWRVSRVAFQSGHSRDSAPRKYFVPCGGGGCRCRIVRHVFLGGFPGRRRLIEYRSILAAASAAQA